jgi:hypothetical protein
MIRGQNEAQVAAANGLRKTKTGWLLPLDGVQQIMLTPPTIANPTVCTLTVNHDIDQAKPIVDALGNWAASQYPALTPNQTAYASGPGATGWSWYYDSSTFHKGVVFTAQKRPDGKPIGKNYDVSTVLFMLRSG